MECTLIVTIKYVILGFLSETPLTGYDLKKKFASSEVFHWSGNNNQIYRSLVELHDEQLVTLEVQQQDNKPPRKVYTITEQGRAALHQWMVTAPELPQIQHGLLVKLTWADQLAPAELSSMLATYAEDLRVHVLMLREQAHRNGEHSLKDRIAEHWISIYQAELDWVMNLQQEIGSS